MGILGLQCSALEINMASGPATGPLREGYLGMDAIVFRRWIGPLRWTSLAVCVIFLCSFIDRGFDITDESFYLAWTVNPVQFAATIHPFGYALHLLFEALGRSVIAMRLFGIGLLLATGAMLGAAFGRFYRGSIDDADGSALPVLGALCSLAYYGLWILTPGYNLLVNAAYSLILAGCLGWAITDRRDEAGADWLSSILVGVGGFIAFFAKPTFAALAAFCIATMIVRTALRRGFATALTRFVAVSAICTALILLVLEATIGPGGFIRAMARGAETLNFGNSPKLLLQKTLGDIYYSSPILWISATFAAVTFLWSGSEDGRAPPPSIKRCALLLVALCLGFLAWNVGHGIWAGNSPFVFLGVAVICLTISLLAYGLVMSPDRAAFTKLLPVGVLLVTPFAASFGSAISIMAQTGMYLSAPLLAALVGSRLLATDRLRWFIEIGIIAGVPLLLVWSAYAPFHLPRSMLGQSEPIHLAFTNDTLWVDRETQNYFEGLQRAALRGGMTRTTPVIDLSGAGPGTTLALGGRAPFYPWLFHMYGDPVPAANATWLSLTDAEKRQAWLIGPIDHHFDQAVVAKDFAANRNSYHRVSRLEVRFWGRERRPIEIWKLTTTSHSGAPR